MLQQGRSSDDDATRRVDPFLMSVPKSSVRGHHPRNDFGIAKVVRSAWSSRTLRI